MLLVSAMFKETETYGHRANPEAVDNLLQHAIGEGQSVFLAEEGDDIVGFCAWVMAPAAVDGEVVAIGTYVAPEHRRKGLSAELRETATSYWAEHGAMVISGAVDLGSEAGMRSLQSNGFSPTGYIMEKTLND